jgi:nitrate/TMAO reductase-like tetraheme cytochrome c subunit
MRRLPYIILLIVISVTVIYSQSPHGEEFDYDCELCHEPVNWEVIPESVQFDHGTTGFEIIGQHSSIDCESCHKTLKFSEVESACISCHTDLHQGTVGKDCIKCHTSKSWMFEDINNVHQVGRFPLLGKHLIADCAQCHTRYVDLYFEPLSTDCYDCHSQDYLLTSSPNHTEAGFSTDCQDCHEITSFEWTATNIVHDFFPLLGGHALSDCFACHEPGGNFSGLSQVCYTCHQQDYEVTTDPNHLEDNFPTDCEQCHTINAWIPANIDHNLTAFPLTGKHIPLDCSECHSSGFTGTPTDCYACHKQDYESVQDPNHVTGNYNFDCTECHTTNGWEDVINFNHNITLFELTGAHITADCSLCHSQGYAGTPIECFSCHENEYNNSTNPNHIAASFPTTCEDCHSTVDWIPATFDHDGQYFPIYTGKHSEAWTQCIDCHVVPADYSVFSCIDCHEHNQQEMDDKHQGVEGYIYASSECFACHPTGEKEGSFDHSLSNFPLTGAHTTIQCIDCHESGYTGTSLECVACHQTDFDNTTNPNHQTLALSTECESCHTTDPNWQPALFPQHNQVYELLGAHLQIANDCAACHNGDYNNTPTVCFGCHEDAYNNATNPNHVAAGISNECEQCHNFDAWIPSTFDHSSTGFELLGAHFNIQCSDCHEGTTSGLNSACLACHKGEYNSTIDPPHMLLMFSEDCLECHNMNGWLPANFNHSFYPVDERHEELSCNECHSEPNYQPQCLSCHLEDFLEEHNPGDPTDCWSCHNAHDWSIGRMKIKLKKAH